MKQSITIILLVLLFCTRGQAQQLKPDFEMKIWVIDSKGNKDSMIIGYAKDSKLYDDKIHIEYGEKEILMPYDSILEIRGAKNGFYLNNENGSLSKRIVVGYEASPPTYFCGGSVAIPLYIYAKYLPVKIVINPSALEVSACDKWSHIFPSTTYFVMMNKWSSIGLQTMYTNPIYTTDFNFKGSDGGPLYNTIFHQGKVLGKVGIQKLPGIIFKFESSYSVATHEQDSLENSIVVVSPNPNEGNSVYLDVKNVQSYTQGTWQLHSGTGQVVASYPVLSGHSEYQFSLPDLPNGLYVWHLTLDGRVRQNGKLVVLK